MQHHANIQHRDEELTTNAGQFLKNYNAHLVMSLAHLMLDKEH